MRTPIMDWEDYQSNNQIESSVQVFIRPPIVNWTREPIPDLINYIEPEYFDCCCHWNNSFSSYYTGYTPVKSPVPDISVVDSFCLGLVILGCFMFIKNRKNRYEK